MATEPAQPTPGPFQLYEDNDGTIGIYITNSDGTSGPQVGLVLTETLESETDDQAWADAQLFAGAPGLLAAAEYVEQFMRVKSLPPGTLETMRKRLAAAIAAARDPNLRPMSKVPPCPDTGKPTKS